MKVLLLIAALCVSASWASGEDLRHTRLTTDLLERTYKVIEKADNDQDWDTILAYLASNVIMTVSFPDNPNITPIMFSKDTYAKYLDEISAQFKDVSSNYLITGCTITDNGQSGIVTSTYRQKATLKDTGRTITSHGKQIDHFTLINGFPKATKIDVTIRSSEQDSNKAIDSDKK